VPMLAVSYFPADDRVLYEADGGGDELTHLFVRAADGSVRDVTPGERLKAGFLSWSADGTRFFIQTNERDPALFDVYEVSAADYTRTLLYRNEGGYFPGPVSPDGRRVALLQTHTTSDSDIWLFDRASGTTRNLTAHQGPVQNTPAAFSPDGRSLYLVTDEGREFAWLARVDLETGARTTLLQPEWDVLSATLSPDGRYMAVAINADASTELRLYEAASMRQVPLPALAAIHAGSASIDFSRHESRVALHSESSGSPGDVYVVDVAGGEPRRLTHALNPRIDPAHLVEARVVRFASFDGLQVPGLLYRPHVASARCRVPAVVAIHGGPGDQSRATYSARYQFLVNHGYAVYAINNRGSSGYGKTFYAMDDRHHGEGDLDDVVESRRMLAETGWVDPEQIAVLGFSYGGFLTLAALAFRPDAFRAGVDLYGVVNWPRTIETMPAWWGAYRDALLREMGDPATDRERLTRISPLMQAGSIRRPLLVLQGANDPRVMQTESDQVVAAVRANGVPVEYVVFPDEGHGFVKKENQETAARTILAFLERYVPLPPCAR
ncbi:MAG TPA: S9 family peptidase, partial [Longimicrobium sp.]|nr:S9 family peptidase [Longimicrobium sp.]